MPVYRLGDLVCVADDIEDDAIGFIIEMRAMPHLQPEAKVLWSDMPEPRWIHLRSIRRLEPVQSGQALVE